MLSRTFLGIGLLIVAVIVGVSLSSLAHRDTPDVTSNAVRGMIQAELPVGAPPSAIEAFFKQRKIDFVWDEYSGRYVAIIRDVEPYHSITIDIHVTKDRRFSRAEVHDTYTMP